MPCSGGETEGDFGVNSPESEEWRTQLDVVGAAGIEAPGVAAAFLAGGGGGRGWSRIGGCPRWRAGVVVWFDVPGALQVGPAAMS
jgi:hypothetical protein